MESINSIRSKRDNSSKEFKILVEELKDSNRRVGKQNDMLRSKLGVESESNKDISRKTKALCNSILEDEEITNL